jgi:tetratricopeptide (TPR) repeat protein
VTASGNESGDLPDFEGLLETSSRDKESKQAWLAAVATARKIAANGQPQRAVGELETIADEAAHEPDVLIAVADAFGALARFEAAERALERATRIGSDADALRTARGVLFFRRGLYNEADAELAEICLRHPQNGTAHYYRGEALSRLGRVDEAIDCLQVAIAVEPQDPRAFNSLGRLYDRKGRPDAAAAMYRTVRELGGS